MKENMLNFIVGYMFENVFYTAATMDARTLSLYFREYFIQQAESLSMLWLSLTFAL